MIFKKERIFKCIFTFTGLLFLSLILVLLSSCIQTTHIDIDNNNYIEWDKTNCAVNLDENATTGYIWVCNQDIDKETYSSNDNKVGSGGKVIYNIKPKNSGEDVYNFQLKRSWENHAINEINVTVVSDDNSISDVCVK